MHLVYPLPPPPPPSKKKFITIVFDLSWDDCNIQEKLETLVLKIGGGGGEGGDVGGGGTKVYYGLCENSEW